MKKIWLSSLGRDQEAVQGIMASLKTYGLEVSGHFWVDDLEKMAWIGPRKELLDPAVALWTILASARDLEDGSVRYGLSMLALAVQAVRGIHFPVVILQVPGGEIAAETLPTPLAGAEVLAITPTLPAARLVAMAHRPAETVFPPYRLDVYAIPRIGQWLEVGPREDEWQGAMLGVSGGAIALHAVGAAGRLPERSVLNYPQQGLKIELGATTFTAWAVQNEMDRSTSYFVKVEGAPDALLFGPYAAGADAEMFVIRLK